MEVDIINWKNDEKNIQKKNSENFYEEFISLKEKKQKKLNSKNPKASNTKKEIKSSQVLVSKVPAKKANIINEVV